MIKVEHSSCPQILIDNETSWTSAVVALVDAYGSYDEIPKTEKDAAVNKYRHQDIQTELRTIFHDKCVFCESSIGTVDYSHIEHFYPKSIYYREIFSWSNLFIGCNKCNGSKSNYDTRTYPIVHPEDDNPEVHFSYRNLRIVVSQTSPDPLRSQRTIDACDLHRIKLSTEFSTIQLEFNQFENDLRDKIIQYDSLTRGYAKTKILSNIHDAIELRKFLSEKSKAYAGFLRYLHKESVIIADAIRLINADRALINLQNDFTLD